MDSSRICEIGNLLVLLGGTTLTLSLIFLEFTPPVWLFALLIPIVFFLWNLLVERVLSLYVNLLIEAWFKD